MPVQVAWPLRVLGRFFQDFFVALSSDVNRVPLESVATKRMRTAALRSTCHSVSFASDVLPATRGVTRPG
jgi:hypothetical protein